MSHECIDAPPQRDHLETRVSVKAIYDQLVKALETLSECITVVDAHLPARTYWLPMRHKDSDKPHTIEPKLLDGHQARQRAAEIISETQLRKGQDPRTALRCPGMIAMSAQTAQALQDVNALKEDFKMAVKQISDSASTRKREIVKIIPYASLMHIYRPISISVLYPNKVSFGWAVNTQSSKRMTRARARSLLDTHYQSKPENWEEEAWDKQWQMDITKLAGVAEDEILVQRNLIAPHPEMRVYIHDGYQEAIANLPLFYPHVEGRDLPPFRPLGTMDTRFARAKRCNTMVEDEPFIQSVHLYRYKAA